MPPNTPLFLLGLAVGTGLLVVGVLLGYWLGRKSTLWESAHRQQFLSFLKNLSSWTSEFSGDVNKYQQQLNSLSEQLKNNTAPPREEILELLSQIMQANERLQQRLDTAEEKLEVQTDQISHYLTEARTDGLTGLINRRAFDGAMDELFGKWSKQGQTFSLGLIDIDHFKQVNDTFGHPAGDAVLRRVADLLQNELDEVVCVARYGGEEFSVLSTTAASELATALDRLRERLGQLEIAYDGHTICVTLSAGAAEIQTEDKLGKLVRRADEALYTAKEGGRNRVYLHDGTICHLVTPMAPPAAQVGDELPLEEDDPQPRNEQLQARVQERLQRLVQDESRRFVER